MSTLTEIFEIIMDSVRIATFQPRRQHDVDQADHRKSHLENRPEPQSKDKQ